MKIKIIRGCNEIGGSAILVESKKTKILLDAGASLKDKNEKLNFKETVDGLIISHAHGDHYGEIENISYRNIYLSKVTENLINGLRKFMHKEDIKGTINFKNKPFNIGDIKITPYLLDHSAYDAHGFFIECESKTIFYTGDFRNHGRKEKTFYYCLAKLVEKVDVLIVEGTTISRKNIEYKKEEDIEDILIERFKENGLCLINMSAQNIDRIVTVYKACRKARKFFVIDFYTAYVLENINNKKIPQWDWDGIKVFYPKNLSNSCKDESIKNRYRNNEIKLEEIMSDKGKYTVLVRNSIIKDIKEDVDVKDDLFINSNWEGYLEKKEYKITKEFLRNSGIRYEYIHISGHIYKDELKKFIDRLMPKVIIPVHTENPEGFKKLTNRKVEILENNKIYEV